MVYSCIFTWIVAQMTFWLGTLYEPECSTSVIAFLLLSSVLLFLLTFTHCLVYASYQTSSKLISVKYQREKDRLEDNAHSVRRTLLKAVFYEAMLLLLVSVTAFVFMIVEQIPKYLPGDMMLSCRIGWSLLLVDGIVCIIVFILWVLYHKYHFEWLEILFKNKKRHAWEETMFDQEKTEDQKK